MGKHQESYYSGQHSSLQAGHLLICNNYDIQSQGCSYITVIVCVPCLMTCLEYRPVEDVRVQAPMLGYPNLQ